MQRLIFIAPSMALVMLLGGCGGGGGGAEIVSTPRPIAAPPPTPAPTSPPTSRYSGPIALQSSAPFATTGYTARHSAIDGADARLIRGPAASDVISFRQVAGTNQYEVALPLHQPGILAPQFYNGSVCSDGTVCQPSSIFHRVTNGTGGEYQNVQLLVPVPGSSYPDPKLTYTSLVSWTGSAVDPADANRQLRDEGLFAYGIPTAAGDVPTSGTGTYSAHVRGLTTSLGDYIEGSALLTFDFGRGTLSGEMKPLISDGWDLHPLGTYSFAQTVFGVGSTTFSGQFDGPMSGGSFEGRFTGPQAAELFARWQLPYLNPDKSVGSMFGTWVGKRQ